MKSIFITIFQGVEFRNIVRTDVYKNLISDPSIQVVLFTDSEEKKNYYQKEFSAPNVIYEVVSGYRSGWSAKIFWFLKFNLINTKTLDIKRRQQWEKGGSAIAYYLKLVFNRIFAHSFVRRIVRSLDWLLVRDRFWSPYFEKYQPSGLLAAHLFSDVEIAMLREAKRRGISTVGLINSWDKLTARCMIRLLSDRMIVHNRLVKEDAVRYADMNPERISVSGIPHFDFYFTEKRQTREQFCAQWGLDPKKPIILYTPVGRTNSSADSATLSFLDELLLSGKLKKNSQLIVRFPPNDEVELPVGFKNKIVFQTPGKRFSAKRGTDWDMSASDFQSLADTLKNCDLLIGYSSTMAIDAAVFDRPIINIGFDFPGLPSMHWVYDVTHYQPVLKSGAVRLVENELDLIGQVNRYLEDPSLDRDGRARLVSEQCEFTDGNSGKRMAQYLKEFFLN